MATTIQMEHFNDWPNTAGFQHKDEQKIPVELKITGSIPPWLAGTLLRVGPATYHVDTTPPAKPFAVHHWFDGFTRVHKFDIVATENTTKIFYSSRDQVDSLIDQIRSSPDSLHGYSFGQRSDPCESLYRKIKTTLLIPDPNQAKGLDASIGVAFAPAYYANTPGPVVVTTDRALVKQLDVATLEPGPVLNQSAFHPQLRGGMSAAHPCVDPQTGDLYNYNLEFGLSPTYHIFHTSAATGETTILASLAGDCLKAAYIHSLFLTPNFVLLCIWPAHLSYNGLGILWKRNILDIILPQHAGQETIWLAIDRHGRGLVQAFTSPPMFAFHAINAYETPDPAAGTTTITADLCQFDNLDILHRFYYDNLVSNAPGAPAWNAAHPTNSSIHRYTLADIPLVTAPPSTAAVLAARHPLQPRLLAAHPAVGDLPQINRAAASSKHRYVYTVLARNKSTFMDGLSKLDVDTGEVLLWEHDKHTPGEAMFVARPGATNEDDGVVVSIVFDGPRGTSYLLVLDAKTMREVGRAEAPVPVTFGFHGVHLPAAPA